MNDNPVGNSAGVSSAAVQDPASFEWTKTPPTEPGFYWLEWAYHAHTIAQFTGKHWWLICLARKVETQELVESQWYKFGPMVKPQFEAVTKVQL
jgi:hypothetical protein